MDVEAACAEIVRTLNAATAGARPALAMLIDRGIQALAITPSDPLSLDDIVRIAADAAPSEGRRDFAHLLVRALGIKGLLPTRGGTEQHIHSFLERALLNPLRRAGYPFTGTSYEKRQALAALHATIDEHLHPLEPSIPLWLHGVGRPDEG
ncbi:MAG: hypothetical protein ABSA58_02615 [Acetobacteraceae bacterium]|jgi:hypothetical protein